MTQRPYNDRIHNGRLCREIKQVRRPLDTKRPELGRADFIVFEYLDKRIPAGGSMGMDIFNRLPAGPVSTPAPARVKVPLFWQRVAIAAESVLFETGAPCLQFSDSELVKIIAERAQMGREKRKHQHARAIISSLRDHPGNLLQGKQMGARGKPVITFMLPGGR